MAKTRSSSRPRGARVPTKAKKKQAGRATSARGKAARSMTMKKKAPAAKKPARATVSSTRTPARSKAAAPRASTAPAHVWPGLPPGYFDRAH